jgi:hypothetical protein
MSNTTLTPTVAALAATGAALATGLAVAPAQAEAAVNGILPTATAVSPVAPPFNGQPLSWSALKASGAGAAVGPLAFRQARLTAAGTFGSNGSALIQVSADNVNWSTVAAMTDAISPGAVLGAAPGMQAAPIPGGVVLSVTDASANPYRYLRPAVQGGDPATSIAVTGALSATGAV